MLSHVWLFLTPWTVARQVPLSMGFSKQEYWSGLPFPSPGNLPDPGIKLMFLLSPASSDRFFTTSATWEAQREYQFSSVAQSCPTLYDPMDCSTPGFPVHHQLLELAQTHVHWVTDAIQPSHLLLSSSPAFSLSQHQGLSNESVLHIRWPKYWSFKFSMSFQSIFRTDFI